MQINSQVRTGYISSTLASFRINMFNLILLISSACIVAMFCLGSTQKISNIDATPPLPEPPKKIIANSVPVGVQTTQNVSTVVTDALAFYNMLSGAQQTSLQLVYTPSLARKWSNLPCGSGCRNGLQLGTNLTSVQFNAAMQVIADALSASANNGYDEYHQMNLAEAYLHANGGGTQYDSTLRWMAFLNTPSTTGPWMLQFGGHHYASNIAFNNGHVVGATPFFMGLEPKTFTYNSVSYDPLGDERDTLRAILSSLSSTQLSTAYISSSFSDCVMIPGETNGGASSFPASTIGQSCGSLTTQQQNLVLAAIRLYVGDMDTATANNVMTTYTNEILQTYVSYHGSGTSGNASSFLVAQGDYVRISGPHVWIEFSCQGGIIIHGQIHYHTVWRDRSHDYGVDLSGPAIDVPASTTLNAVITPAGSTTFCSGGNVVLNANTGAGYSYQWQENGTIIPSATTSSYTATASGNYLVTISDGTTTATSSTVTVTVNPNPSPAISGSLTFCSGNSVLLDAGAGYSSYLWSSGATTQTINVNSSGTYTATVTNSYGCSGSISVITTSYSLPSVSFSGLASTYSLNDPAATLIGTPQGGTFSGTGVSGNTFDPAIAGAGGPYTITYLFTDSNGCTNSSSLTTTVNGPTGINSMEGNHLLVIYPNPVKSFVTIQLPVIAMDANAILINRATGQSVKEIKHISGDSFVFDVSDLAPGYYFLKVQNEGKSFSGVITKN